MSNSHHHTVDPAGSGSTASAAGWVALMIGNSRLHWAKFVDRQLQQSWDTSHLEAAIALEGNPELWIASVVPTQAQLWQSYPQARFLQLADIALPGLYPTLGIDRALAVWGAIATYQTAALVIDAGTALTFTAATPQQFVGGAILPGLMLQFKALHQGTAALPVLNLATEALPHRWALDTEAAITSGIGYTILAGIQSFVKDWHRLHADSVVLLTGGDGERLHHFLRHYDSALANHIRLDADLIFKGMQAAKSCDRRSPT